MKFQCERCKTRYSIADEKVRGKILRIRCKSCESIITVREGEPAKIAPQAVAAGPGVPRPRPSTIEIGTVAPLPAEPPPPAREWFLSVDGEQEGPFSAEQAQARVARKAPAEEMFAWRDDFTEWLPVEQVPVLAIHVPRPRVPPPPPRPSVPARAVSSASMSGLTPLPLAPAPVSTPTPRPTADLFDDVTEAGDPFAGAAGSKPGDVETPVGPGPLHDELTPKPRPPGGLDFDIDEASRMVRMPMLTPAARPQPAVPQPVGLPGLAPAARADQSLNLQIASLSGDAAPVAEQPPVRRRRLGLPLLVGGVAVVGVLAAVFFLTRGGDDGGTSSAGETRTSVLVDNFYSKDNPLLVHEPPKPVAPASAPAVDPALAVLAAKKPAARPHVATAEAPVQLQPVTRPDPPRMARPPGKTDSFDADAVGPSDPLTPDDVRNAYAANEVGLKRCYERALKVDPSNSVNKMVVKITISAAGTVSEISVPDKGTELATCVATSIRSWRFRRSPGELTTEFTVFFAKRG